MPTAKELIDMAEKCFRQADDVDNRDTAEALREMGLQCLDDACLAPVQAARQLRAAVQR